MRVLLLNPPVKGERFSRDGRCQSEENTWLDTFPPTMFASIAGVVRNKYNIKVIDCIGAKISFNDCISMIEKYQPDFTVINTATPTIETDLETAKRIKQVSKSKIIMYGEHVTARYNYLLKNYPQIDYAVLGEAETPTLRILEGKIKSKGVATRKWDGGLWQEPDLDKLPFPAYDLLPPYYYPLTGEKWMFVRSGRGCPYNCTYCVMPYLSGRKIRYHSPEYMVKQLKWLADDLGIRVWMFWDELATFDKERMKKLCDLMIKEQLHKRCKWFCTTRVDAFDYDLAKKMREAGCRMVSFGFESGNQKVLDMNRKGITLKQSRDAVKVAKRVGMRIIGHFIIGLPGSTEETEKQTIEFAKELGIDFAQFYTATPFPGSEFYQMAKRNGWFVEQDWKKVEQGSVAVSYPNFPKERIEYWRRKAYHDFYMRPISIIRGLTFMSPKQILLRLPNYVSHFFDWMKK